MREHTSKAPEHHPSLIGDVDDELMGIFSPDCVMALSEEERLTAVESGCEQIEEERA